MPNPDKTSFDDKKAVAVSISNTVGQRSAKRYGYGVDEVLLDQDITNSVGNAADYLASASHPNSEFAKFSGADPKTASPLQSNAVDAKTGNALQNVLTNQLNHQKQLQEAPAPAATPRNTIS